MLFCLNHRSVVIFIPLLLTIFSFLLPASGPVLIKMGGKKGNKKSGNLLVLPLSKLTTIDNVLFIVLFFLFRILISGGKCGSPTLIKGGGGEKKGGSEMYAFSLFSPFPLINF